MLCNKSERQPKSDRRRRGRLVLVRFFFFSPSARERVLFGSGSAVMTHIMLRGYINVGGREAKVVSVYLVSFSVLSVSESVQIRCGTEVE